MHSETSTTLGCYSESIPASVGIKAVQDDGTSLTAPPNAARSPRSLKTLDESELVAEAKAGCNLAFGELVTRYERRIFRLALHITETPEDAEDVLQEAFLKAFEHLADFRGDSRFYTWIVRIAVNEGLMKLRKRRSDKAMPIEDFEDEEGEIVPREIADWRPNPEQALARTELEALLTNAARTLPPSFRTVFFLRDVEGLSNDETAQMLSLTVNAVKARLHRARLHLREELSKAFRQRQG